MRLMFGLILLFPLTTTAATYYVRPGGSDSHSCRQAQTDSDAMAKGTIQGGLDCPEQDTSGHTIIVHGGEYTASAMTEVYSSSRGTSWSDPNLLKAADGEVVWLRRQGDVLSVTDHINPRDGGGVRENSYWIVERVNVDCQGGRFSAGVVMDNVPYIRLKDMEIQDCRAGIAGGGDSNEFINLHVHDIGNTAEKCVTIEGQQTNCYGIYYGGSNGLIQGGSWHDMGLYCMHIYNGNYTNHNVRVEDVKVCRCGQGPNGSGPGIGIFSSGHTVRNNTVMGTALSIWSSPGNTLEGNTVDGDILIGETTITAQNQVSRSGAGGDACAYVGPGPGTPAPVPPVAGGKLPPPRNFRISTRGGAR